MPGAPAEEPLGTPVGVFNQALPITSLTALPPRVVGESNVQVAWNSMHYELPTLPAAPLTDPVVQPQQL